MNARKRQVRDAYYNGVIDYAHGLPDQTGEWGLGVPPAVEQARAQGHRDAKIYRTMRPQDFDHQTLVFRIEVYEQTGENA